MMNEVKRERFDLSETFPSTVYSACCSKKNIGDSDRTNLSYGQNTIVFMSTTVLQNIDVISFRPPARYIHRLDWLRLTTTL